jgi:hypothetical protein
MNLRTRITLGAAATAAAVAAGVFAPAAAERAAFTDPADTGGASLNDIRRVTVDHSPESLAVKVRFKDLRRRSDGGAAGLTILFDTRPRRSGPEFRLTSGLQAGTDYQLMRVRDGRPVGEPLTCPHRVRLHFAKDTLRFHADRQCLGTPRRARISVKMTDMYDASHPVRDWLGAPRSYTPWLASS